jgi:hypothetical protein
MNLISLPNEVIYIVMEYFLDTLGDIVVIRQVCRVLKDVCDGALPSLETEIALKLCCGWDIALALGNNGPQKIFSPAVVEHRAEIEKCGFNYNEVTNDSAAHRFGKKLRPGHILEIDKNGFGFWILHVRKLRLHSLGTYEDSAASCLIKIFNYLEHKKRMSPLHLTFCEHGVEFCPEEFFQDSAGVRRVVNKINNSSLNICVDFQIRFFTKMRRKMHLGPKFSKCVIYPSMSDSERLCDVVGLLPHHNVSLCMGYKKNQSVQNMQNMQIITESCGRNVRKLKLKRMEIDAGGVLDDLNVDEVVFEEITWSNRPSNKPECSARLVKLVTMRPVEFEIFNFTKIKQLHWKAPFMSIPTDWPTVPLPLTTRILELDLLKVDWPHDRYYYTFSYSLLRPIIQHSKINHLVVTTNIDVESFIPTDMDQLETISIIYYHENMDREIVRMTPLEFIHFQTDRLLARLPSLKLVECYDMPSFSPFIRHRTALNADNINAKRRRLGLI